MKEKDFQTKFTRWLHHRFQGVGAFELKICKGTSLPFDAVQPHQLEALFLVSSVGIEYKIPDDTRGTKPFDCFRLQGAAYVVIMFYRRGCNHFYMIPVDRWHIAQKTLPRKSLTEAEAARIGTRHEFA